MYFVVAIPARNLKLSLVAWKKKKKVIIQKSTLCFSSLSKLQHSSNRLCRPLSVSPVVKRGSFTQPASSKHVLLLYVYSMSEKLLWLLLNVVQRLGAFKPLNSLICHSGWIFRIVFLSLMGNLSNRPPPTQPPAHFNAWLNLNSSPGSFPSFSAGSEY